ncbi:MAG: DJ-1/PfpI family protein [Planctomycetes bacterium]|nr:DJ-1/PfpI family protein [Planctomycetota bacterium]
MFRTRSFLIVVIAFFAFTISALPSRGQEGNGVKNAKKDKWNVAIIIHDGVELLDFAGPGEVFQAAAGGRAFNVYAVADSTQPVTSQRFLKLTPNHAITDCPKPDIVVIPGGNTNVLRNSPAMMKWVKAVSADAEIMFSVCTGAFVLADLGLLDGKEATTHWSALKGLEKFSKVKVCPDRRVVDNGKIVTSAGVSAGIDGALHIVARLCGMEAAKKTARYMEYRWAPDGKPSSELDSKSPETQARVLWFSEDWDGAAKAYAQIVTHDPKDAVAHYRLGICQTRLKQNKEARASLEQALKLGMEGSDLLATLGRVYLLVEEAEKAGECLEKAVRSGSGEYFAQYNLACARALSGKKEQALAELEKTFSARAIDVNVALLDTDFASLRKDSRFRELFRKYASDRPLRLVSAEEPGKPLVVTGTIRDADGKPVAGALLEIYQADNDGNYTKEPGKAMSESQSRIFGYIRTRSDGKFEFKTIVPGYYPRRDKVEGDAAFIPKHIHINVTASGFPNRRMQMVFVDDPRMTEYWHDWAKKGRHPVGNPTTAEGGLVRCTCDLTIQAK